MKSNKKNSVNLEWKVLSFKESIDFHWCDVAVVDGATRFKVFCQKSDCECFVEDVQKKILIPYKGGKSEAFRIIETILQKEASKVLDATEEKIQKCYTEIWKTQIYPAETRGKPKGDDILKREFKWLK